MYNHRHHRPQHRPNNPLFRPRFPIFRQQFPQFPQFPRFHHYHPHHAFAFGNFWHAEDPSIQHEEQQLEQEETSDAGLAPVLMKEKRSTTVRSTRVESTKLMAWERMPVLFRVKVRSSFCRRVLSRATRTVSSSWQPQSK